MAHEHAAETLDVDRDGRRPGGDRREAPRAEATRVPLRNLLTETCNLVGSIGVTVHDAGASLVQQIEHLRRPRPADAVAGDDDLVHAFALYVREHRLERREVPVDVADRGDAHCARLSRFDSK